jgi:glycosyltransferase involved in cell wall biosynthesis
VGARPQSHQGQQRSDLSGKRAQAGSLTESDTGRPGVLALTWFEHRRTRELCAGLGIELALLDTAHRGARRYLLLGARTFALLNRRRPDVLLVQNPSLVLGILSVVLRPRFGYRLIVDAHNEAVQPHKNPQAWIRWLSRWVVRRADLTIVTNRQLAESVRKQGGRPFVLPDRIPRPPPAATRTLGPGFNVVLIATFASDEPIGAIFDAVRDSQLELYVTGDARQLDAKAAARVPANVRFTGFLPEEHYWGLLRSADAIIDLTLKPDCLVCGASEALALGKPMLLSNNAAGVELFGDAAVFTDNSPGDIRRAIERVRTERDRLASAAQLKCMELTERWQASAQALSHALSAGRADARTQNA